MWVSLGSPYLELSPSTMELDAGFLPQGKEVFSHYFSNKISAPFSFSSPPGIPMIWMLVLLIWSMGSLDPYTHFLIFFFFSFCCSAWVSSTAQSSNTLILCLLHLVSCWVPLLYFSDQLLYSLALWLLSLFTFFYFPNLCWCSHYIHPFFSPVWWASLWPLLWILYHINNSPQFHYFLRVYFVHLEIFLCFFILFGCLCWLFIVDEINTSVGVEGIVSCRK